VEGRVTFAEIRNRVRAQASDLRMAVFALAQKSRAAESQPQDRGGHADQESADQSGDSGEIRAHAALRLRTGRSAQ
jgi:hypothetical protein